VTSPDPAATPSISDSPATENAPVPAETASDTPTPPYGTYIPQPPEPRRLPVRLLVIAAVVGLVVGAGVVGLVWLLTGTSSGRDADIAAVCEIVERTPDPTDPDSITLEYVQRWTVSDLAASVAKDKPEYQPLADSLNRVVQYMQLLALDETRTAVRETREICAGY
jgi:hypothetical protein